MKQLLYKVYCARDKVLFYFWRILNFHGNTVNLQNIMVKIVVSISQYILVLRRFVKIKRFIFHSTYCRFVVDFFNSGNTYMNTLTLICMTFSPTSTHYQPTPTHFHSLSIHSHPLPFMFSTLLLILNPPPPLPLNLSPYPNTLT